ncbi:DUF885 family protein [Colwelliaceae bacterium 6441]
MQLSLNYFIVIFIVSSALFAAAVQSESIPSEDIKQVIAKYQTLSLAPVTLDFNSFWQQLHHDEVNASVNNTDTINKLEKFVQLHQNKQMSLPFCQRLLLGEIAFQTNLAKERKQLSAKLANTFSEYTGSFTDLPNGKAWYRHWLKSWLMAEVDLDTLTSIAHQELADVKLKRATLINTALPRNNHSFIQKNHSKIVQAFKARERIVNKRTQEVLGVDFQADAVNIIASTLPKSFPAPGIYNAETQSFIYHLQQDTFPEKHMDWLFLHEGVPGHHYQSEYAINNAACPNMSTISTSTVFLEGWAAYVETLGQELGLYQDSDSFEYALDWQALRAVRVLLDIAIHDQGWTDQQAQQLWLTHIPKQKDIMNREIARIRRWPAQVITYVYGKSQVENAVNFLMKTISKPEAHQKILALSNLSLLSLKL